MTATKREKLERRRARVRTKIRGTGEMPRLSFHISNKHCYAQAIDDTAGVTLASSGDKKVGEKTKMAKRARVVAVGHDIATQLTEGKKINSVVFDRGGKRYAGNVKVFADAAREKGLVF